MSPNRSVRGDVFFAIGDRNRRRILELLSTGERTVGELRSELEISQPSVSQHLGVLSEAGLVEARRAGTSSIYRIVPGALEPVTSWAASIAGG